MNTDESYEDEDLGPSKAEILADLSLDALKTVPLEESLRDAIRETHRIKSFGAIKRHKQYLGKLMRNLDEEQLAAIQLRLDAISGVSKAETAKMHHLEKMRDDLIKDDAELTKLIASYPDLDIQNLRTLIRNARKERELNKPPKAYREIFQLLKSLDL